MALQLSAEQKYILKIFGEEEIETIQNTFKDYAQKSKNKR